MTAAAGKPQCLAYCHIETLTCLGVEGVSFSSAVSAWFISGFDCLREVQLYGEMVMYG